jgi:glycerate 2-kinase
VQGDGKPLIQNINQLTAHGNSKLRKVALDILEHALEAADPYRAVNRTLHLEGETLLLEDLSFDLKQYGRIFILGAGKASRRIALALEEKLGDRITDGLVVLKCGDEADFEFVKVIYAAHPIPDVNSYRAAAQMLALAETFRQSDLVFAGITGGSSALLELPAEGISLEDIQKVYELLLLSGADIVQINAVRKHLSRIKGGLLAKTILPATLINLTVSDVVGDMLDYITCPTVPDTSTFDDARRVLDEYDLWDSFPKAASRHLRSGGNLHETPKDFGDLPLHTFLVVKGDTACVAAADRARELGFNSMILTSKLKGEARDAGTFFASIAHEVIHHRRPVGAPCVLIAGGENVVTIGSDERGTGGPNQEFALSASIEIAGLDNIVIASIDTDGIDGSSQTAGVMVDGSTIASASAKGLDPKGALRRHDVDPLVNQIGEVIITGPTGTNVNDLKIMLVT